MENKKDFAIHAFKRKSARHKGSSENIADDYADD